MKSMKKLLAALLCLVTAFTFILGVGCGKKPGGSTWDGDIDFSQDGKAYKEVNDENVKRIPFSKTIGTNSIRRERPNRPFILK